MKRFSIAIVAASIIAAIAQSGQAQGETPPPVDEFVTYDPATGEYTLNLEALTPVGTVITGPPESWPLTPPEFMQEIQLGDSTINPFMMVYNRYVSPDGYYMLVPTLYTAVVMTVTNSSPFDVQPYGMVVNGWVGTAGFMGWMENIGYSREDVLNGDWRLDPGFWAELFLAVNDPNSPLHEGTFFAPPAVLIYTCDPTNPADCAAAMTAEASSAGSPTPVPSSDSACPVPTAIQAEIRASGELVAPPYPVVVGQDPQRRGADLQWRVEVPPVVYSWYEAVVRETDRVCRHDPSGSSGGCPGPGSQYDEVVGSDSGWHSFMADSPNWRASGGEHYVDCVRHVEVFTDRLRSVRMTATLEEASRDWILVELAARYPGASLYQPDWTWLPPLSGHVLGDGTFVWEWTQARIQFRDPGQYAQVVEGSTMGTPVTDPRYFNLPASGFQVWLYEATLTR